MDNKIEMYKEMVLKGRKVGKRTGDGTADRGSG